MPIVSSFGNFYTPQVQLKEQDPPASITGASQGQVGVVVQSIRGAVGVPTLVSDLSDYIRKFGTYSAAVREDFMFMYNMFTQGCSSAVVVRATDGNEATATLTQQGSVFAAGSPGTWGNGVTLVVTANPSTGYVDLQFAYGTKEVYKYAQVTFTDATDSRYFKTIIESSNDLFVSVTTAGVTNLTPGTYTFAGGTDGTLVGVAAADSVYAGANGAGGLTGLVAMEAVDTIEFVVAARANTVVNAAVLTHVSLTSISPRVGVVAPASGTIVSTLTALMATINSDRLVMTYPFLQVQNPYNNLKKEYHNPVAFYVGMLSTLSYHQSPTNGQVVSVLGTERALTKAEIDTLSQYHVSPIQLKKGLGFVVYNGYNTSTNPSKSNITRRRAFNFFERTFEAGLQQFVGKPQTPALRLDIIRSMSAICQGEVQLGKIGNVTGGKVFAIKCDDQNNPAESVRASKLIVEAQISLWSPADFILVTLDASEAKSITLQ